MVVGAKALFNDACTTVSVWLVTPLVSTPPTVTLPDPLVYAFAVLEVTTTVPVQFEPPTAAFTPWPPMVKVPVPAVAVMVGAPPQLLTTFGTAAITRLAGSESLKVRLVRAAEPAGLLTVKVSVEVCPTPMVAGAKALVSAGRLCTVSPELVTLFVMRAVAPMLALVLLYGPPTTLEVTSTVTTHEACAALIEAPVTVMLPPPPTAVAAPVPDGHVVVTFGVAATSTLAGSVSVKLMPDCAGLPAPLVIVKVSVEVPPASIVVGAKALFNDACTTVSVWLVTPFAMPPIAVTLAAPLVYTAAVVLVTSTLTVEVEAPTAELPPLPPMVKVPVPAAAVTVGAPPQLFTTFGVPAMTRLAGQVSVKVRLVRASDPAGLVTVKVSVLTCPTPMVVGAKALVSAGRGCTVRPELVTLLVTRAAAPMLALVLL